MATKQRQRRRPQPGRRSFQRRLTWQEVEGAFDHLFRHGLDDDTAERITFRFRRARTQVMPVLSWLVVSPYEIERNLGLGMVRRVGGQAALRMLDDLIADSDVYDPFKRELRLLRETVDGGGKRLSRYEEALDEEEDEEAEEEVETDEAADVAVAEPREDEPADERRRRERRPKPKPRRQPAAPVSADLFDDGDRFLAALDGPIEPLIEAFRQVGEAKRLSFIDRAGKLDDDRVVAFLLPLLETDEWALVQSALNALGNLGRAAAVPAVEKLAEATARKRVKLRAERVLERLRAAQPEPGGDEPAEKPKRRRRRRRRGGAEAEAVEPEQAELETDDEPEPPPEPEPTEPPRPRAGGELGLRIHHLQPVPVETLTSLAAPAEVPRLRRCLAGPIRVDGRQRLTVERGETGGPLCRLSLEVDDQVGLRLVRYETGLPADAGEAVEVPAGYVRARLDETVGESLAGYDLAPLHAFIGPRRRAETALDLPTEVAPPGREAIEALLDHPLFADWKVQLDLDGAGLQRWVATRGRRSASRIRRRLIDDAVAEWLPAVDPARLVDRLRRQAWLLKRGRDEALADHLLAVAAAIDAQGAEAAHSELVREMAYRGFTSGGDAVYTRRRRRRDYAWLAARRAALARSTAQRARRR